MIICLLVNLARRHSLRLKTPQSPTIKHLRMKQHVRKETLVFEMPDNPHCRRADMFVQGTHANQSWACRFCQTRIMETKNMKAKEYKGMTLYYDVDPCRHASEAMMQMAPGETVGNDHRPPSRARDPWRDTPPYPFPDRPLFANPGNGLPLHQTRPMPGMFVRWCRSVRALV